MEVEDWTFEVALTTPQGDRIGLKVVYPTAYMDASLLEWNFRTMTDPIIKRVKESGVLPG